MYTEKDIRNIVEKQREFFLTGKTLDVSWRIAQLKKLKDAVSAHEKDFEEALAKDLGRSRVEAYHGEWGFREFTHPQTVLTGKTQFNLPLREHPYGGKNEAAKMKLLKIFER